MKLWVNFGKHLLAACALTVCISNLGNAQQGLKSQAPSTQRFSVKSQKQTPVAQNKKPRPEDCYKRLDEWREFIFEYVIPTYGYDSYQHRYMEALAIRDVSDCFDAANAAKYLSPKRSSRLGNPLLGQKLVK